jgi:hypothetical protein
MVRASFISLVASIAFAPFAAQAANDQLVESCVKAFVADHFPGQEAIVRIERDRSVTGPLVLRARTSVVQVTASDKETGRTLLTATCSSKDGELTLVPRGKGQLVAAR